MLRNREHHIFLRFHFIEPGIARAEHSCYYATHTGACGKPLARKITILTYRKNKNPGGPNAEIWAYPVWVLARSANMFVRLISVRAAEFSRWFFTIRLIASAIFRHDSILEIAGKWNMDV
uniref:Uncharacterized protein n=1 Tax=Candidatus Kentrum sp. UNK TaxID=2126344 RepID=A0A451B4H8_9GAMM|nr:MAG: hypothetical protein BECKUNK1418H_GA0071006_11735 [Candidatus Kentron sp. UNK]